MQQGSFTKQRGMFGLFKKSTPEIPYTDKVWKTSLQARKGMLMMAMLRLQQAKPCLLVNFFESERHDLMQFMTDHKLNFVVLDETTASVEASPTLYLVDAFTLAQSNMNTFLSQQAAWLSGEVFFAGHYPLPTNEQLVLKSLMTLGYSKFVFCLSFDDALLKAFGTPSILPLLEKLGMEDEEAIEHDMVKKSIQRVREKIESKVGREIKAKSPEEWFALNVKEV